MQIRELVVAAAAAVLLMLAPLSPGHATLIGDSVRIAFSKGSSDLASAMVTVSADTEVICGFNNPGDLCAPGNGLQDDDFIEIGDSSISIFIVPFREFTDNETWTFSSLDWVGQPEFEIVGFSASSQGVQNFGASNVTLIDGRSVAINLDNVTFLEGEPFVSVDLVKAIPVPEPTALAMFGLGLFGLGLIGRRRRS